MGAYIKLVNAESAVDVQNCIEDQARQAYSLSEFLVTYYNDGGGERSTMSDEIMAGLLENISERLQIIRDANEMGGTHGR